MTALLILGILLLTFGVLFRGYTPIAPGIIAAGALVLVLALVKMLR